MMEFSHYKFLSLFINVFIVFQLFYLFTFIVPAAKQAIITHRRAAEEKQTARVLTWVVFMLYSYFIESTGFASDALIEKKLIVNRDTPIPAKPAIIKIQKLISVLYAKFSSHLFIK